MKIVSRWMAPALLALTLPVFAQAPGGNRPQRPIDRVTGQVDTITDTTLNVKAMRGGRGGGGAAPEAVAVTINADTLYGAGTDAKAADLAKDAVAIALVEGEGAAATAKGVAVYGGEKKDPERLLAAAGQGLQMAVRMAAGPPAAGQRPAPLKPVLGKIKSADGGNLVLTTKDGDVTLKLADKAVVRKVVDKAKTDVKAGLFVTAMYAADYKEGDAKVAKAVLIMAAPQGGGRGGAGGGRGGAGGGGNGGGGRRGPNGGGGGNAGGGNNNN